MRCSASLDSIVTKLKGEAGSDEAIEKVLKEVGMKEGHWREAFLMCAEKETDLVKDIMRGRIKIPSISANLSSLVHEMTGEYRMT